MILFAVTEYRWETVGKVAEYCPNCSDVRAFAVCDYLCVDWSIFFGTKKTCIQSAVRCRKCRAQRAANKGQYKAVLPADEEIDLDDLVAETNPGLAQTFTRSNGEVSFDVSNAIHFSDWRIGLQDASSPVDALQDARVYELFDSIKEYEHFGRVYDRLNAKLARWRQLNGPEREALVKKVEDFVRVRRLEEFLITSTATFPAPFSYLLGAFVYLFCLIPLLAIVGFFWNDLKVPNPDFAFGCLFFCFSAATVTAALAGFGLAWWRKYVWFKEVMIPRGEESDVNFQALYELLERRQSFGKLETAKLKQMRKSRSILYSLLRHQRKIA